MIGARISIAGLRFIVVLVFRLSVALLMALVVISFCFGDPVGLYNPVPVPEKLEDYGLKITDKDNLEFARGTLKLQNNREPVNRFEIAKQFEDPHLEMMNEITNQRQGLANSDAEIKPVDLVFEFDSLYRSAPNREAIEIELWAMALESDRTESIRRLAAEDRDFDSPTLAPELKSPFRQTSFPTGQDKIRESKDE